MNMLTISATLERVVALVLCLLNGILWRPAIYSRSVTASTLAPAFTAGRAFRRSTKIYGSSRHALELQGPVQAHQSQSDRTITLDPSVTAGDQRETFGRRNIRMVAQHQLRADQVSPLRGRQKPPITLSKTSDGSDGKIDRVSTNTSVNGRRYFPSSAVLQSAGPFIARHAGTVAVFHIPGELTDDAAAFGALLRDIALCNILGVKLVLVMSPRMEHDTHDSCNALRSIKEETGCMRTEMERVLSRCLHAELNEDGTSECQANVLSGNFYDGQRFDANQGQGVLECHGYVTQVYGSKIQHVLDSGDVVLLNSAGFSPDGDSVIVSGYQLTATVAASLQASTLIYMARHTSVTGIKESSAHHSHILKLPLSLAQSIASSSPVTHTRTVIETSAPTEQSASFSSNPAELETEQHLSWSSWAMTQGVENAYIVNPYDGALLEVLFTSSKGQNTHIYHDGGKIQSPCGNLNNFCSQQRLTCEHEHKSSAHATSPCLNCGSRSFQNSG